MTMSSAYYSPHRLVEDRASEVEITGNSIRSCRRRSASPRPLSRRFGGRLAVSICGMARTRQKLASIRRQANGVPLRSGTYLKMDETPVSSARHTIMGVYPRRTALELCPREFPTIARPALKVLGVPEDPAAVRKRSRNGTALELEERSLAKGAGGMVRTMKEWRSTRRLRRSRHCR